MPFFANTPGNKAMNTVLDKYYPGMRENGELFLQEGRPSVAGRVVARCRRQGPCETYVQRDSQCSGGPQGTEFARG